MIRFTSRPKPHVVDPALHDERGGKISQHPATRTPNLSRAASFVFDNWQGLLFAVLFPIVIMAVFALIGGER